MSDSWVRLPQDHYDHVKSDPKLEQAFKLSNTQIILDKVEDDE